MNRTEEIGSRATGEDLDTDYTFMVSVESGDRARLPMVLTSSDNPASHILGKHCLQQETTEDPAKSCYGLRLSEQLPSSTAVDEIMRLESKDPSPRALAKCHSLSFPRLADMHVYGSTVYAYLPEER